MPQAAKKKPPALPDEQKVKAVLWFYNVENRKKMHEMPVKPSHDRICDLLRKDGIRVAKGFAGLLKAVFADRNNFPKPKQFEDQKDFEYLTDWKSSILRESAKEGNGQAPVVGDPSPSQQRNLPLSDEIDRLDRALRNSENRNQELSDAVAQLTDTVKSLLADKEGASDGDERPEQD